MLLHSFMRPDNLIRNHKLTWTSLTTSYSSTSASLSIATLLKILLKSVFESIFRQSSFVCERNTPKVRLTDTNNTLHIWVLSAQLLEPPGCLHWAEESIRISYAACDPFSYCLFGLSSRLDVRVKLIELKIATRSVSTRNLSKASFIWLKTV